MSGAGSRAWLTRTPEETEALARQFSRALPDLSRQPAVAYLIGGLGAGKTTWARGFLAARGLGHVHSPTYSLLEVHALGDLVVVHLDLYRVAGAGEIEALGARELHAPGHLWLVEWAEHGVGALPAADLEVTLELHPSGRRVRAVARTPLGASWLLGLPAAPSDGN